MELLSDTSPGKWLVRGVMDETSDFEPALATLSSLSVVDLGGVTRINSLGVRQWLNFVRRLPPATRLERCPVSFVNQLNMIANFAGSTQVSSVFVPYLCPRCEADTEALVEIGEAEPVLPSPLCETCRSPMELDVEPSAYFAFLGSHE
jgi:hypothetical protein